MNKPEVSQWSIGRGWEGKGGGVIKQCALYVRQRVVTQAKSIFTSSTHEALPAVTFALKTTAPL
jgi:hypothetical protein